MLDRVMERVERLLHSGEEVLRTEHRSEYTANAVDEIKFHQWRGETLSFLAQVFGETHTYLREYSEHCKDALMSDTRRGVAYLRAAKAELDGGLLKRIDSMVSADVFSDFLEMAGHLLEQGYKDPAASLIGAVLEDGLRKIARARQVSFKERDDLSTLSNKLADAEVFNRLTQKRLKVWGDIRNNADHGKFGEYDKTLVAEMHRGVQDFLAQHM
jgi:hypothetical protein